MTVIQPAEERHQLVLKALEGVCKQSGQRYAALADGPGREQFLRDFLSYDLAEEFLNDPSVEDIMINATEPIYVHRTGEGLVKTDRRFSSHFAVKVFVKKLLVFAGRVEEEPISDIELADIRGRVNIITSPFGPQITITRGKLQPLTILQLIDTGMLTCELAAQLWMYIEGLRVRPANLIISGGPGAGKTTLLNALLSFIPASERIVTIEDTLELNTRFLENCARLESCRRVKTPALVKNSLRMRPERILVGEVRGEEARDLMTAMNLGKYCMGTLHASTARETVLRLQNEPMNVPPVLVSLVDVFVILRKLNRDNRVLRIVSELVETSGMERDVVLLASVWSYDHEARRIEEAFPSSAFRDRLSTESGRPAADIMQETARRAAVLKAMQESGRFPDMPTVTEFCQRYSRAPEQALAELGLAPAAVRESPAPKRKAR